MAAIAKSGLRQETVALPFEGSNPSSRPKERERKMLKDVSQKLYECVDPLVEEMQHLKQNHPDQKEDIDTLRDVLQKVLESKYGVDEVIRTSKVITDSTESLQNES